MFRDALAWREEQKLDHILDAPFGNAEKIKRYVYVYVTWCACACTCACHIMSCNILSFHAINMMMAHDDNCMPMNVSRACVAMHHACAYTVTCTVLVNIRTHITNSTSLAGKHAQYMMTYECVYVMRAHTHVCYMFRPVYIEQTGTVVLHHNVLDRVCYAQYHVTVCICTMHTHTHTHTYTYACTCTHTYTYTHIHTHTNDRCIHPSIHTYIHTCIHTYIHHVITHLSTVCVKWLIPNPLRSTIVTHWSTWRVCDAAPRG